MGGTLTARPGPQPSGGADTLVVQSELMAVLGSVLKPLGFRRRRANWFRCAAQVYSVLNVQKQDWGNCGCYINFGFAPADHTSDGWLGEHKCVARFRIDSLATTRVEDLLL